MVWVAVDGGVTVSSSSADGVCHYVVVSCSAAQWRITGDCPQPLPLVPAILSVLLPQLAGIRNNSVTLEGLTQAL